MTKLPPGAGALAGVVSLLLLTACSGAGADVKVGAKAYDPALRTMKIGTCLTTAHSAGGLVLGKATIVPCTKPHNYEVYAHRTEPKSSTYPDDTLPQDTNDFCSDKFRAYTGLGPEGSETYAAYAIYPDAKDWKAGHRVTTCVTVPQVGTPASTTFTSSAKGHGF